MIADNIGAYQELFCTAECNESINIYPYIAVLNIISLFFRVPKKKNTNIINSSLDLLYPLIWHALLLVRSLYTVLYVTIMIDVQYLYDLNGPKLYLINLILQLSKFFSRDYYSPQAAPPPKSKIKKQTNKNPQKQNKTKNKTEQTIPAGFC